MVCSNPTSVPCLLWVGIGYAPWNVCTGNHSCALKTVCYPSLVHSESRRQQQPEGILPPTCVANIPHAPYLCTR
ncbi:hypothetical protein BDV41DRAFT_541608 [Aspergillus transmontanensis]|uniref:Uncharacterized protein n=1 Tax=Aspergillus transmontanensis TaxID=1034304 RepID=A0A5N6VT26_9EURO|nr:hypothetical protein BDV41DRAFT_541608 [Aspergillus transmontanensis]